MLTPKGIELYSLPGTQKFFRERMGTWQEGDPYLWVSEVKVLFFCEECNVPIPDMERALDARRLIRLPLPIDPINPERGLLGMLNTPPQLTPIYDEDNKIVCWEVGWMDKWDAVLVGGKTITEALLRALMQQEGIEE